MRREELEELIRPVLQDAGLELVQCSVARGGRIQNIRIILDHPSGLSVDTCGKASRRIATLLDANPLLRAAYSLEVSSPGMRRPIWSAEHFRRFVGERVRINLRESSPGPHFIMGIIGPDEGDAIWIEPETIRSATPGRAGRERPAKARGSKGKRGEGESDAADAHNPARGGKGDEPVAVATSAPRLIRLEEMTAAELDLDPWKPREKKPVEAPRSAGAEAKPLAGAGRIGSEPLGSEQEAG